MERNIYMEEILRLTKELIRFRSTAANLDEINRCADFIESYLKKCRIEYQRLDYRHTPSILVAPQKDTVPVMLMSHMDVVEGPDELFEPYEKDGRLYGRGSIDDKYAVALSLVMLKENLLRLQKQGSSQSDLPFGILVTGDEEIGSANGAKKILPQVKADFCITLDGGGVDKIVIKEKGIVHLKLIARGKSGHAARPWLGLNAIENLIADYQILRTYFEATTPDHWHRTLNFSRVHAGKSINQVPDYAEAVFDIRYTENDDVEALVTKIQDDIQGQIIVEKKEPMFVGGDSPYLDLLLDIAKDTRVGCEHGASDARFLSRSETKGIVWGADGDMSQHSATEHINIDSLARLYELLDRFMQKVPEITEGDLSAKGKRI
jgi:succinyl-diaminopimelate desuccinylase